VDGSRAGEHNLFVEWDGCIAGEVPLGGDRQCVWNQAGAAGADALISLVLVEEAGPGGRKRKVADDSEVEGKLSSEGVAALRGEGDVVPQVGVAGGIEGDGVSLLG